MSKILSRVKHHIKSIFNSIGFYPSLISLLFFGFAVFMIYMETRGISKYLKEDLPFFIITHGETAIMILSTIATGIFSLIVFSFTMVMLVLNQASSNFSPRVIPGLISSKSNQKVLGLYLGTLIYTLVIMVNIRSEHYSADLPGLAVFMAMCFTFVSLGFFVYFIHSISSSIQIGNIIEGIYEVTLNKLRQELELDEGAKLPAVFDTGDWQDIDSSYTGYLQTVERDAIIKLCKKHDAVLEFLQPLGHFVIKGLPFARVTKGLKNTDKFKEELNSHINLSQVELADVNYLYGFKQITESVIKALSPSINDPGTAIKAIDYLTDLLIIRMSLTEEKIHHDDAGTVRLRLDEVKFTELLSICLGPIRVYGKDDPIIILRIFNLLKNLCHEAAKYPRYAAAIYSEAQQVLFDADENCKNPGDREKINAMIIALNATGVMPRNIALLST